MVLDIRWAMGNTSPFNDWLCSISNRGVFIAQ